MERQVEEIVTPVIQSNIIQKDLWLSKNPGGLSLEAFSLYKGQKDFRTKTTDRLSTRSYTRFNI